MLLQITKVLKLFYCISHGLTLLTSGSLAGPIIGWSPRNARMQVQIKSTKRQKRLIWLYHLKKFGDNTGLSLRSPVSTVYYLLILMYGLFLLVTKNLRFNKWLVSFVSKPVVKKKPKYFFFKKKKLIYIGSLAISD